MGLKSYAKSIYSKNASLSVWWDWETLHIIPSPSVEFSCWDYYKLPDLEEKFGREISLTVSISFLFFGFHFSVRRIIGGPKE